MSDLLSEGFSDVKVGNSTVQNRLHDAAEGRQHQCSDHYYRTNSSSSWTNPTGPAASTSLSRSKPLIITYTPLFNEPRTFSSVVNQSKTVSEGSPCAPLELEPVLQRQTWNSAVFKDELAGVGSPHAQLVQLLRGGETRHSLEDRLFRALLWRCWSRNRLNRPREQRSDSPFPQWTLWCLSDALPDPSLHKQSQHRRRGRWWSRTCSRSERNNRLKTQTGTSHYS